MGGRSDIARLRYCYRAGSDASGREAVVLIGRQLPASSDLSRVLLHVIRVLASFNGRPFALIYIHGGVNDDVPFTFKRQVCRCRQPLSLSACQRN
jgi:hypothetical protein